MLSGEGGIIDQADVSGPILCLRWRLRLGSRKQGADLPSEPGADRRVCGERRARGHNCGSCEL